METLFGQGPAQSIRLRAGASVLIVPGQVPASPGPHALTAAAAPATPPPVVAPDPSGFAVPLTNTPVIALVEAVPARADELAAACLQTLAGEERRCCAVALDGTNRLGVRLGCPERPPANAWQSAADLIVTRGQNGVVPGPVEEAALTGADLDRVLAEAAATSRAVVIDLGCRWVPNLFRPVMARATHIWVVTRVGQWTGVEMRLEQAEFSGWTDTRRVRIVALGEQVAAPPFLGAPVAAVLPEPAGEAVRALVLREVGRGGA